jgi:hypothetical protein
MHAVAAAIKRFFTGYLLAILIALGASAALAITTRMNQMSGGGMGATEEGRELIGYAFIVVHVLGVVVCGLLYGGFSRRGNKVWARRMGFIVVGSALISAMNIMGFMASEVLSRQKSQEQQIAERKEDRETRRQLEDKRLELQAKLAEKQLGWNQLALRQKGAGRGDRRDMLAASGKLITEIGKAGSEAPAETAPVPAIEPDGGSKLISEMTFGLLTASGAQTIKLAGVTLLLLVLETMLWPAAGYYWGGLRTAPAGGMAPLEGGAPIATPPLPPSGPAQLQITGPAGTPPDTPVQPLSIARRPKTVEEADVAARNFVEWCCDTNRAGVKYWGDDIDRVYNEYCEAQNRAPCRMNDFKEKLKRLGKKVVDSERGTAPNGRKLTYYEIKTRPKAKAPPPINRAGAQDVETSPPANDTKPKADAPQPTAETKAPPPGGGQVIDGRPFGIASTSARGLEAVKGPAVLNKYFAQNIEADRAWVRQQKRLQQQRTWGLDGKQKNRFARARLAA